MSRKIIKYILSILLIISTIISIDINTYGATVGSFSISTSSKELNIGTSASLTISVINCEGRFSISSSDSSVVSVSSNSEWVSGNTTITITAKKQGTATITVTASSVGDNQAEPEDVEGSKSITITVKEKDVSTTNNGGSSNNNGTTNNGNTTGNNDDKPKEPTFTTVNQTVYAIQDGINIRTSYSTSSSSLGKLKKGEEVTRIGIGSNGWSKVNYNGKIVYISTSLLTTTKPEEKSTVKVLKSLTVEPGTLSPEFNPETTKYSITVGEDITKLNINAVVEDEKSKLDISGNDDLKLGENIIKLVVTAEDGTARTYVITVTKEQQEQLRLNTLVIKGINLNPSFSSDIYEYVVDVENNITKLDIEALGNIENANIEILGNEDLQDGENTVTIMLKSEDGKQNVTYQIIVKKAGKTIVGSNTSDNNSSNMQYIIVGSILGGILLIIIIALIVKKVRSNREDDGIELNFMDDIKTMNSDNNILENKEDEKVTKEDYINDGYIFMQERHNKTSNKLYNVEDEVDFSDIDKDLKRRRKGKHF